MIGTVFQQGLDPFKGVLLLQWKKTLRIPAIIFVVLISLNACRNEPLQPMRIGMHVWPGFEPLFLARYTKTLDENNFRLVEFSSGSEVSQAFRNGSLEAACITLDETFYLIQDGMDPVILFVMDESNGADAVLSHPEITSLQELKGKRIGVELNAVEAYMLTRCLEKAGLTINDVIPVYLPAEKHFLAYKNRLVDAIVTYEPVRTKLMEIGAKELFNSSLIPGEIIDVLVIRRDYLKKHPGRAAELEKAWFNAIETLKNNPKKSVESMAVREQITPEEFGKAIEKLHFPSKQENDLLLKGADPSLMKTAERLKNLMLESGLLQEDISLKPLFTFPETKKSE